MTVVRKIEGDARYLYLKIELIEHRPQHLKNA